MADSELTTEYRCGYCYLEFNSMTDPRELPCHHVFCITCLQGDYTDNNNIRCRSCQRVYSMETFDHLPTARLEVVIDTLTSMTCDCHNCDGQNAVSYCIACADKMCDTHQQSHNSFFGTRHQVISISTYELSPGTYKRIFCDQHYSEVVEACVRCHLYSCNRCERNDTSCSEDIPHLFSSLNALKEEITAHFNRLLQSASNKLTEICKLDKHIWKLLDDEDFECKKKIETIERICDEQIEVMREEREKLKEQIYEYQKTLTDQVELYNTELMDKKEKLEESRTKVHKWLRESHVTEKLQQKQQMLDELRENIYIRTDCEITRSPLFKYSARQSSLNINLVSRPTSMTLQSEHTTNSYCFSANYKEDGNLLLGCANGVKHLGQHMVPVMKYSTNDRHVTSAIEHHNNVFILHRVGDTRRVAMCLPDVEQRMTLFSFQYPDSSVSFAAVSDRCVVAINRAEDELVLYEFLTKHTTVLHPETPPSDVHFLPDGDLIIVSCNSANITRYKIENRELSVIWTCEGLANVLRVCTDADGLIYVITSRRSIYIISPDGKELDEIKNDDLPSLPGQISINKRDGLAVPSCDCESVCLFKIDR